ncbi:S8 family serine peptidase [Niallia taxi]|uniref:S8 family serine peptidase n=1 Tax=Niallia taxi TaxID=2499688 RepID=UPI002934B93C|nr:S8 family serine peptidase [Niallia taxi]WOD63455.1 S8 family serine peptidase [Niallia taxi]
MQKGKILVFVIMLFMLFSNSVLAAGIPNKVGNTKGKDNQLTVKKINGSDVKETYKDTDTVRVVVEMTTEPTVDYAQKQAKQVKELPKATKKKLKEEKLAEQKQVKQKVKKEKVKFTERESFTTVFNGFSGEMKYGDIKTVEKLPEVAKVHIVNKYERPEEETDMVYSKELVQAQEAWRDYGFKGEGMIVGVIDTGIDPKHKDMILSDATEGELTESEVTKAKTDNGLLGDYYTEKVPYGYNYMDENNIIQDIAEGASMHGMHVSGTVGANGNEENGGIKGIAPEAQLLALKVFGNDPNMQSTWGDIYIKAIDDAIILGADVINMSLGSTAGFVSEDSPEQQAISKAVDNGILMSISAGNSAHLGSGFANPLSSNPDIGVSGSPGLSYDSLQVASVENSFMKLDGFNFKAGDENGQAAFLSAGSVHPNDLKQKDFELFYAGLGKPENFNSDAKGKFALVQRGEIGFVDKAINAQNAGAAGVIVYNNTDGFVSMASEPAIKIPQLFLQKTDGDKLAAVLQKNQAVSINFDGSQVTAANPESGKMSAFTSWGLTPNLDFKPEITAPGGQIYSTLENNQYGMMSGTSMAAPHVSGGSALVLERVDNEFGVTGFERVRIAKNLLMNTAEPVKDIGTVNSAFEWDNPYSPRRQGAGLMQLHSALQSPVMITENKTKEAKVSLKEVGNKFSFTLNVENFSDSAVNYDVTANLQTDFAAYGELGYNADELEAQNIIDGSILIDGKKEKTVKIGANKSKKIKVTVDLSKAKVVEPSLTGNFETTVDIDDVFENGYFAEGFVTFTDPTDTNADLHVPYVGFKGDWNKAPILDGMKYDTDSFYGMGGAVSTDGEDFSYLGYDPVNDKFTEDGIAISPNADGTQDDVIPVLSFLRNAKIAEFSIVDKNKKTVRTLLTEEEVTKDYYDGGNGTAYKLDSDWAWDGKVNNKLTDGQYYYRISATIDYPGAKPQVVDIPVKVDTKAPSVKAELTESNKVLEVAAADEKNGSGIAYIDIQKDGKTILEKPLSADAASYTLPEALSPGERVTVIAYDYAGNTADTELEAVDTKKDTTIPVISLNDPEALGVFNTLKVPFTGTIKDESAIKEFTIAGKKVATTFNQEKGLYEFNSTMSFKSGVHSFEVKAIDAADNTAVFKRTIMVDNEKASLQLSGLPLNRIVKANTKNVSVDVTVRDNFDELKLTLNGSQLYAQKFKEPYAMRSLQKKLKKVKLELEPGLNEFTFEATDLGGNKTAKTVYFYKLEKTEKQSNKTVVPADKE